MDQPKLARKVVVTSPQGLHMRPADLLAKLAKQFEAKIEIVHQNRRVDCKSMLDLLTLGAVQGTELSLEATGDDAERALTALADLFAKDFSDNA